MNENAREATCVSVFSGIGGMDHGLARAGFLHVLLCESDPWRREVLRARFPSVPVADDVRSVTASDLRLADGWRERQELGRQGALMDSRHAGADALTEHDEDAGRLDPTLLCGGFPCQDLSVAGRRRGLAGERSGLFHEFARIADAVRPRWLLVENVPGLLSSNGGRDFGVVLGTLADLGYGLGWRILDSRYFGVPQRRRRVFIVGARADGDPRAAAERAGQVLAVGARCGWHPATRGEAGPNAAVASLSGLGTGGPDDNDGQGGRLIAETIRSHPRPGPNSNGNLVAPALVKRYGKGTDSDATDAMVVAAPLSHGSNPHSNAAGRRREDDESLVTAFNWREWRSPYSSTVPALDEQADYAVSRGAAVRCLTPTECERLQALPDGWTQLGDTPDSRRYAALGDAVTASVAEWIGRRILSA